MQWVAGAVCRWVLLLIFLLAQTERLPAQGAPSGLGSTNAPLRVIVREIEPFAFNRGGQMTGFAVELWEAIARQAGFKYHLETAGSAREMVDKLAAKQADIGIGALSITSEREAVINFSYPFYNSGLDIVTGSKSSSVFDMVKVLLNAQLLKTLGLLLALVLVFSHILWLFERKVNEEEFPGTYKAGIFESIWWTLTVLITLGCENKSPRGVPGRLMAVIWMASGVLMISLITASFSSSLTVSSLEGLINGPADLSGHKVATVAGSTAEAWLKKERNITLHSYPSVNEGLVAVSTGDVVALVYDEPILRYQLTKFADKKLRLVGALFEKQGYGFGLQWRSPHQKTVNHALLKLIEDKTIEELHKKWFGDLSV